MTVFEMAVAEKAHAGGKKVFLPAESADSVVRQIQSVSDSIIEKNSDPEVKRRLESLVREIHEALSILRTPNDADVAKEARNRLVAAKDEIQRIYLKTMAQGEPQTESDQESAGETNGIFANGEKTAGESEIKFWEHGDYRFGTKDMQSIMYVEHLTEGWKVVMKPGAVFRIKQGDKRALIERGEVVKGDLDPLKAMEFGAKAKFAADSAEAQHALARIRDGKEPVPRQEEQPKEKTHAINGIIFRSRDLETISSITDTAGKWTVQFNNDRSHTVITASGRATLRNGSAEGDLDISTVLKLVDEAIEMRKSIEAGIALVRMRAQESG